MYPSAAGTAHCLQCRQPEISSIQSIALDHSGTAHIRFGVRHCDSDGLPDTAAVARRRAASRPHPVRDRCAGCIIRCAATGWDWVRRSVYAPVCFAPQECGAYGAPLRHVYVSFVQVRHARRRRLSAVPLSTHHCSASRTDNGYYQNVPDANISYQYEMDYMTALSARINYDNLLPAPIFVLQAEHASGSDYY